MRGHDTTCLATANARHERTCLRSASTPEEVSSISRCSGLGIRERWLMCPRIALRACMLNVASRGVALACFRRCFCGWRISTSRLGLRTPRSPSRTSCGTLSRVARSEQPTSLPPLVPPPGLNLLSASCIFCQTACRLREHAAAGPVLRYVAAALAGCPRVWPRCAAQDRPALLVPEGIRPEVHARRPPLQACKQSSKWCYLNAAQGAAPLQAECTSRVQAEGVSSLQAACTSGVQANGVSPLQED